MTKRFIDLSHTIEHGMITYPGLPAPTITEFLSRSESRGHYAEGTEFQIGRIDMVANTGTYLDAPIHRYSDGKDLSEIPLSAIAGLEGVVIAVDCTASRAIEPSVFRGRDVRGKAVLLHSGWSTKFGTERYFEKHPYLTKASAEFLVRSKAALVGIDSLNIDDTRDGERPAHSVLLRNEILVVEHLTNLAALPLGTRFEFFAVPAKVKRFGSFPVRAFAVATEIPDRET